MMMGIRYLKAAPTTFVLQYKGGRVKREGLGLAFFYHAPTSVLVQVPTSSVDVPFAFNESTGDFQPVTIQGQLTYRITDAKRIATLLDFTVGPTGDYASEDPEQISERLVHAAQVLARAVVARLKLRDALTSGDAIVREVSLGLQKTDVVTMLGLEILALSVLSIKATPEMARALEAEAREDLQQKADGAIYARRNAAVEQERRIKESELNTEIAVEEKKRVIRETQMAADIAVEEQRSSLIGKKVENDRQEADSRGYMLDATLKPLKQVDWRTLMAAFGASADPRLMIALAFRELAENAQKIGELNITPDLLKALLNDKK
jgi:hypothetical protein